jgi:hypothetical protein
LPIRHSALPRSKQSSSRCRQAKSVSYPSLRSARAPSRRC